MAFTRALLKSAGGLEQPAWSGAGLNANIVATTQATDSNQTLSVAAIQGGLYVRTLPTVGRTDTTDTAANILAANPDMNVGDTFICLVSVSSAFVLTLAGGTGVTMGTKTTVAASGFGVLLFTKTSATTMTCTVL